MSGDDSFVEVGTKPPLPPPTREQWEWYKPEIISLYAVYQLSEVQEIMLKKYKFYGTKRMYDTRFRRWGVQKNMNAAQKESLATQLSVELRSGEKVAVRRSDLQKLMRYVSSQEKKARPYSIESRPNIVTPKQENANKEPENPTWLTRAPEFGLTDDISSEWLEIGSEEVNLDQPSQEITSALVSLKECLSTTSTFDSLTIENPTEILKGPPIPTPLAFNNADQNLEKILRVVKTYYLAKFEDWPYDHKPTNILETGSTAESKLFWSNLKNGIYLWKIQSKFPDQYQRAFSAFNEANELAEKALSTDPVDFCLELLATLSPINTSIHPPLRKHLLSHIKQTATMSNRLGPLHPITQLCTALLEDEDQAVVSLTALFSMYGIFGEKLGYDCAASEKIAAALMKSMRRAGPPHLEDARSFAEDRLTMTKFLQGERSDEARRTAVELAHILTKAGDHGRALALRFAVLENPAPWIYGQFGPNNLEDMETFQTDGIAIHTMEDIAEYYVRFGDLQEAGSWLAKAERNGRRLWGDCAALGHITDKMENLALGVVQGQVVME